MTKLIEGLPIEMETGQPAETQTEEVEQPQQTELDGTQVETQETEGISQEERQPEEVEQTDQAKINYEYQARRLQSLADKFESFDPEHVERLIELDKQLKSGLATELSEYLKTKREKLNNTDEFGLEIPIKPADFDPVDAITNPDGESGRYMSAMQDYKLEKKLRERDLIRQRELESIQQEQAYKQLKTELRQNFKYTEEEIKDLEKFIADPSTYTTENMVKFHRLLRSKKNPAEQKLTNEYGVIQRNQRIPQPVGSIQGQTPQPKSPDAEVGESILKMGNKNLNVLP